MGKKIKTEKLKIGGDSPQGLKLAYWFWMELGRPPLFRKAKTLLSWSSRMDSLVARSGLDYERFKWFLIWVCRLRDADGSNWGNDFTAQNLRVANDPMASLVKQFPKTFFDIFLPHADKSIPLLMEIREREDAEKAAGQERGPKGRVRFVDIVVADANEALLNNAKDLDRLDDAFPLRKPSSDESIEDWIVRECETLSGDNWRCEQCKYAFSIDDGDDARIELCGDCADERRMYQDEDREWMCFEAPSGSCLTEEWDEVPWDRVGIHRSQL